MIATDGPGGRALLAGLALGPFLALQMLVLQNPAFISSSGDVSLATSAAVVLVGDALALGALWLMARTRMPRAASSVLSRRGAVATCVVGDRRGRRHGRRASCSSGRCSPSRCSPAVLVASEHTRARWPRSSTRAGSPPARWSSGSLVVGYQLHYEEPLPVTNRWLPVIAAAFLGVVAIIVARRLARRSPAPSRVDRMPRAGRRGLAGWAALAVVVVTALVFGGLALSEPTVAPAVVRADAITVMTYNVHETITRDGRLDPDALASAVRRLRPDVLVIEEAGRGWPLSGGIDLAEWAKRQLGMPYVWVPAADHQFGNILFSRVPIRSARIVELPHAENRMKRSAIVARVGPVSGAIVTVIGTHLQEGEAPDRVQARIDEMHAILRAAGNGRHTVIAGDLNSDPGSPELRVLLDAGYGTTQPTRKCTLKTSNDNCVDWILVSPDLGQSTVRAIAIDTFDHRPLVSSVGPNG